MAHTCVLGLYHCVFSTKDRRRTISDGLRERLWAYLGGIARQNRFQALAAGGTDDHVHLLLLLPPTIAPAKALQLLKGGSSKWVHDSHRLKDFAWQSGYGAFTLGISQKDTTIAYINGQAARHKKVNFRQEYLAFLKKNKIDYDPRYVFD